MGGIISDLGNGFNDAFGISPDRNATTATGYDLEIARANAETGKEQLAFARDQAKTYEPYYKDALGLEVAAGKDNLDRARSQWDQYEGTYKPLEERVVSDANNYDSDARMHEMSTRAQADARTGLAAASSASRRDLMRRGVNPASGAYAASETALSERAGGVEADAMNRAREGVHDRAIGLRAGAASFGRNMPNTAAQAYGLTLAGASGTTATATAGMMAPENAANSAIPWFANATSAATSGGNLGLGALKERDAGIDRAWNVGGTIMGMMSSKKVKTDKTPIKAELILDGLENTPVEAWKYKPGVADGGESRRVGPYAEDMNEQFGEAAAPGGEMLDLGAVSGLHHAAIQALAKKVRALEQGGLDMVGGRAKRRSTEPRRAA